MLKITVDNIKWLEEVTREAIKKYKKNTACSNEDFETLKHRRSVEIKISNDLEYYTNIQQNLLDEIDFLKNQISVINKDLKEAIFSEQIANAKEKIEQTQREVETRRGALRDINDDISAAVITKSQNQKLLKEIENKCGMNIKP